MGTAAPPPTTNQEPEDHTFLNVHSGLSAGLFAGLDVGAQDRWEYLIMGEPIFDVAKAEGDAEKGQIVVSPLAHCLLCNDGALLEIDKQPQSQPRLDSSHEQGPLPCGCTRTKSGCYNLAQHHYPQHDSCAISFSPMEDIRAVAAAVDYDLSLLL